MEKSATYKWVVILFFGAIGVLFMALVLYLATGRVPSDSYFGRSMKLPRSSETVLDRSPNKVVLELNKGKRIGNRIFFYKGVHGDYILLDVIIPELDGQYPYPLKIPLKDAERGFTAADCSLQLTAFRDGFASLLVTE